MSMDVSIVIPTFSRPEALRECLSSFMGQTHPQGSYEIIVVDDAKSSSAQEIVHSYKDIFEHIFYYSQKHKGPAAARNLGAAHARGEIIGFVDDDCTVSCDWVRSMYEAHRAHPHLAAVGGVTITAPRSIPAVVSQFLSTASITVSIEGNIETIFFPTCNVSFKRNILARYYFNEQFLYPAGEDLEFFWRLFSGGFRFLWAKHIRVVHARDVSKMSFLRQAYLYGRGNYLVQKIHANHPLLKEIRTKTAFSFWAGTLFTACKILRFSFLLGGRCIREEKVVSLRRRLLVYLFFLIHKLWYISGTIAEFCAQKAHQARRKRTELRVPQLLILDITHSCNTSCRICDIWKTKDRERDIPGIYIKRILGEAQAIGIPSIALSGGEPLLREDIADIFEYARSIGLKHIGVLTNGMVFKEKQELLLSYLVDETISLIISFDSLDPSLHNEIRNEPSAWVKTREALGTLSEMKRAHPRIGVGVITILLNDNLEEALGIARYVFSLGVDTLQFQPLLSNNLSMAQRKASPYWVPEERLDVLDETLVRLIQFKQIHPDFLRNSTAHLRLIGEYYRGSIKPGQVQCASALGTVLISNKGECRTCFSCYGTIKNTTLERILRSPQRMWAYRKAQRCSWPCMLPCFCDTGGFHG